ncbi:MAG: glycosyltransferase [Candidatus Thorarchaeota archaeon]
MTKTVLLIGSQPERMIRLKRTFNSLKQLGVDVKVMQPYNKPGGRPRIIKGIIRYLVLLVQVAISKADIYHFFNVPDVIGLPLTFKRGTLIYDVRSPWFSSIKESLGNTFLSKLAGMIEHWMTCKADIMITANYPIAHRAHRWGASRITMVPNYPPADFSPSKDRKSMRDTLFLGDSPTVLYVGKISKIEGSDLLKQIIFEVCNAVPNVKFLIVGDGPEKPSVDSFIEQKKLDVNVISVGWVPHEEVANYITASDLCLLPRKWDSFSPYTAPENITKAAEYLAVGRPIIAPKMGGFATATFPVIPVEPAEMGKAVIDFLKNPKDLGDFERPSWDISHERLKRIYTRLGTFN